MMLLRSLVLATLLPASLLGAQRADTVVLSPTSSVGIDIRGFKPHQTADALVITKGDSVVRSSKWINNWYIARWRDKPIIQLLIDTYPGDRNAYHLDVAFDGKTTGVLHNIQQAASGRWLDVDLVGPRVTGQSRLARDSAVQPVDFTLDTASYLAPVMDFTVGAVARWNGVVVRMPAFDMAPAQRKTVWHTWRLVGTDTVRVGERVVRARIVEDDVATRDRLWIIDEPPYVTRWTKSLPDGSTWTLTQAFVRLNP
jgi:hypothetical protein